MTFLHGLTIRISMVGKDALKVVWEYESHKVAAYQCDASILLERADQARAALRQLVDSCLASGAASADAKQALRALARAGSELRVAFFTPLTTDDLLDTELAQKELLHLPFDCRLHFALDDPIQVPWALMYDDPAGESGEVQDANKVLPTNAWWGIRYACTATLSRKPPRVDLTIPRSGLLLLHVFNKSVITRVRNLLPNDEGARLDALAGTRDCIYSSQGWAARMNSSRDNHAVVHCLCHANASSLAFDSTDVVSFADLRTKYLAAGSGRSGSTLLFLNGCYTAVAADKGAFLRSTAGPGCWGFIGTEAPIPDVFAARFGDALLRRWAREAKPVYEIVKEMRRSHWPLSLVYSVYCPSLLRLDDKWSGDLPADGNYCDSNIGSHSI